MSDRKLNQILRLNSELRVLRAFNDRVAAEACIRELLATLNAK